MTAVLMVASLVAGALAGASPAAAAGPATAPVRAVASRSPAQPPPTSTPGAPGSTLVALPDMDLPDPFLVTDGSTYDMYLSTAFGDPGHFHVPLLVGVPGAWAAPRDAMPEVPAWAAPSDPVWAPDVVRLDGQYVMYSAPELRSHAPATHCIAVARSSSPLGPFVPVGTSPLVCQLTMGGDIDAQLFSDPDGPGGSAHPDYLIWKSDNNNLAGSGPTTIWAAPVANDGLTLTGKPTVIFRADRAWQRPVLEAPQMVHSPLGGDWLIFSAGRGFFTADYAMGAAKCAGPLGPCHSRSNGPFLSSNRQGAGPGEETVLVAPNHTTWVLYSPWHTEIADKLFRPVETVQLGWRAAGPYPAKRAPFPAP